MTPREKMTFFQSAYLALVSSGIGAAMALHEAKEAVQELEKLVSGAQDPRMETRGQGPSGSTQPDDSQTPLDVWDAEGGYWLRRDTE